jgi:hypothetical protein
MQYSKEEKVMWLDDWKASGKSAWGYAKENGLNPQTFINWTKPKSKVKKKQCFVEISAQVMQPTQYSQEILIEKGEVKIHIPMAIGSSELRTIFGALGGAV